MFLTWSGQVVGFWSCSGLNGLAVTSWYPTAAAITMAAGRTVRRITPCRATLSRNRAVTTPESANPAMTMEMIQ